MEYHAQSPLHFAHETAAGAWLYSVWAACSCRTCLSLDARLPRHARSAVDTAQSRAENRVAVTAAASPARLFVPSAFPFAFVLPFPFGAACICTARQTRTHLDQSRKHQQIGRAKHLQQREKWGMIGWEMGKDFVRTITDLQEEVVA